MVVRPADRQRFRPQSLAFRRNASVSDIPALADKQGQPIQVAQM